MGLPSLPKCPSNPNLPKLLQVSSVFAQRLALSSSLCWLFNSTSDDCANMSAYGLDYLFHAVIGVRGSYRSKSHVSTDLQDGLQIGALGNGPMLG